MGRGTILFFFCLVLICVKLIEGNTNNTVLNKTNVEDVVAQRIPGRIVNGTKAVLGQFPQQVSLRRRYSESHFCGGSILTPDWILTAGHCMFDKNKDLLDPYTILIIAGEIILKSKAYARQWSYVKQLIVHPEFDYDTLINDVALLKLKTPLRFDGFVNRAILAKRTMKPGTVCQVSGWGYQRSQGQVSSTLMYVDLPLMPIPLCRELLKEYSDVPDGMFCAGYIEGGKDACQGDSGGGMMCEGLLTGVVSGGEGCAWPKLPGLYSDTFYYSPWINQYVDFTKKLTYYQNRSGANATSSISSTLVTLLAAALYVCLFA